MPKDIKKNTEKYADVLLKAGQKQAETELGLYEKYLKRIGAIERLNVEKYGNKDFYKEETPEDIEERITEILEITKMVISEKRKELNLLTHESGTYPNDNELLNKLIIDLSKDYYFIGAVDGVIQGVMFSRYPDLNIMQGAPNPDLISHFLNKINIDVLNSFFENKDIDGLEILKKDIALTVSELSLQRSIGYYLAYTLSFNAARNPYFPYSLVDAFRILLVRHIKEKYKIVVFKE